MGQRRRAPQGRRPDADGSGPLLSFKRRPLPGSLSSRAAPPSGPGRPAVPVPSRDAVARRRGPGRRLTLQPVHEQADQAKQGQMKAVESEA